MMTVGRASDILISEVQDMLSHLQKTIGFEYIKLCGIFSDELHVYNENAAGSPVYSFSYTDKVLDFVCKNNLKPWIQLSYMPEKLAKYPNKRLFGSNVSQPQSVNAWCMLVLRFYIISVTAMVLMSLKTGNSDSGTSPIPVLNFLVLQMKKIFLNFTEKPITASKISVLI